ncbi:MAG: response regulator [Bacteroidales bacterium]|nr:response regulator [Bacteroidales bacterium]
MPTDEVSCLYQDAEGYIWIVTYSGLVRYDGYSSVLYTLGADNDEFLEGNLHRVIGQGGEIYVATEHGMLKVDRAAGRLVRLHDPAISGVNISALTVDRGGRLWAGGDKGVFLKGPDDSFSYIPLIPGSREKPVSDVVDMKVDADGNLWFTSWGRGLFRYDIDHSRLYAYTEGVLSSAYVLHQDSEGALWVGTWGSGLLKISDPSHPDSPEGLQRWSHASGTPDSLMDDIIYDIDQDREGNIWIGTRSGLSILPCGSAGSFVNIYPETGVGKLPYNEVNAILRTRDDTMWVGLLGGGLCKVVRPRSEEPGFSMENVRAQYKTSSVRSIYQADSTCFWLGISGHGLIRFNSATGEFRHYSDIPEFRGIMYASTVDCIARRGSQICFGSYNNGLWLYDPSRKAAWAINSTNTPGITEDCIRSLKQDSAGNIWIGTRGGIFVLTPSDEVVPLPRFIGNPEIQNVTKALSFSEDTQGNIWVATGYDGILRIDPASGEVTGFQVEGIPEVHSFNSVLADSHGNIWAGSSMAGLFLYDARKKAFVGEESLEILRGAAITNLTEDPHGNIWVTTGSSVLSFVKEPGSMLRLLVYRSASQGYEPVSFNRNVSAYVASRDAMVFGTSRGLQFYGCTPAQAQGDLSGIEITGIHHGEDIYRDIEVSFSIFDFDDPAADIYYYRLSRRKGAPGVWKVVGGGQNKASFTGLRPGNYVFEVYGSRSGSSQGSGVCKAEIKVPGNPWVSWWAILLYVLAGTTVVVMLVGAAVSKMRMRRKAELDSLNQQKADEINQARLQFFTNVSHEFLTPLSIILASVESLEPKNEREKNIAGIMSSNAVRLTRMVQQVLDFRKAESDNLRLKVSENDVAEFIGHEVEAFIPLVRKRDLQVSFTSEPQAIRGWFDPDKVDKIVYNLLSNAVKYTPVGGTVRLQVKQLQGEILEVTCANSGKLMSSKTIAGLFKRFYEGDYRRFNTIGNGIGLSLVKSLVTIHKGTIEVVSNEREGNCFIVRIPIGKDAYQSEERDETGVPDNNMPLALRVGDSPVKTGYTVLCIDDNEELCELLSAILSKNFSVITSTSARAALDILREKSVDVIVCDVAMPEMDGLQFCSYIKQTVDYSHIPVILLTAKTDDSYSISGFRAGADGYLTKPCNYSVLTAMILNLIGKQEKMSEDFRKQLVFEVRDLDYTSVDKQFLQKAIDVVNAHIADSEFSQTDFVREMSVSRTVLTEKLKNLTGFTPSAFILNTRLTLAYKLLCEEQGNIRVSDLAYSVGFSDAKYFSKCFKSKYKRSPREIMEEHKI